MGSIPYCFHSSRDMGLPGRNQIIRRGIARRNPRSPSSENNPTAPDPPGPPFVQKMTSSASGSPRLSKKNQNRWCASTSMYPVYALGKSDFSNCVYRKHSRGMMDLPHFAVAELRLLRAHTVPRESWMAKGREMRSRESREISQWCEEPIVVCSESILLHAIFPGCLEDARTMLDTGCARQE